MWCIDARTIGNPSLQCSFCWLWQKANEAFLGYLKGLLRFLCRSRAPSPSVVSPFWCLV
ncbi:uncharacterized protein BO88DRAFT_408811 [Aspergillus vadensis CBS 113365]|uniref:Uncharacterized protein n=1 Tax=Aspergillus vadensis (strain CBS 113365 / IMI 142717 / IBT 24658) TaxID=1448311 RepID=A0A319AWH8_ASPVC|nr:hypothetical protein BO88DRAFT_408811 [Aspergillus vadensis CBS 113365]PYH63954.1 hypothetical protein BO88DRAFT_408811 [Aspergillus vadensis CBS 113365]